MFSRQIKDKPAKKLHICDKVNHRIPLSIKSTNQPNIGLILKVGYLSSLKKF